MARQGGSHCRHYPNRLRPLFLAVCGVLLTLAATVSTSGAAATLAASLAAATQPTATLSAATQPAATLSAVSPVCEQHGV